MTLICSWVDERKDCCNLINTKVIKQQIQRKPIIADLLRRLGNAPAVGVLGARQVGKTTLSRQVEAEWPGPVTIFDLELPADRDALAQSAQSVLGRCGRFTSPAAPCETCRPRSRMEIDGKRTLWRERDSASKEGLVRSLPEGLSSLRYG